MNSNFPELDHYDFPFNGLCIDTIDMHTEGEPLRIVYNGLPAIKGDTILEKRRYFRQHLDHIRKALINEPRGHADMYAAILFKSEKPEADFDVFFLHNEGYSTMCGHAIIALTKMVFETGLMEHNGLSASVRYQVPAGMVYAEAIFEDNQVRRVSFQNVPSFVYCLDNTVKTGRFKGIKYDIAFGGAFYAIIPAEEIGLPLDPSAFSCLKEAGKEIKQAIIEENLPRHPFEDDLSFLYGCIFTGGAHSKDNHSRNVCIFADGELDRSPTGSGVSARAALEYHRSALRLGEKITIESIIGSKMQVEVIKETKFGDYNAIVPQVSATSFFTGKHRFYVDPKDPFKEGFFLR